MSKEHYRVSVAVHEATATKNDKGAKSYAWAVRGGQSAVTAWGPFFRAPTAAYDRSEEGPGVLTVHRTFFEFRKPFPSVSRGNRIIASGTTWEVVHPPRQYARTYQVDVERVQ